MIVDEAFIRVAELTKSATFNSDEFEERFSRFDGKIHKFVYQFLHNLPGPNKQISGIIFCSFLSVSIYIIDVAAGPLINLRPLILLPLLIGAFYFERLYVYINTFFISIVYSIGFRDSNFPGQSLPFLTSLVTTLIGFGLTAQFVLMLKTLIRNLLEHVEDLEGDVVELKEKIKRISNKET